MEKSKERCVAEAMITEYLKMKKGEYLAITADQGSNFPQLEAYLDVCHEKGIRCTILKTATPLGQSKAAEETVPVDATREFLMNVDCWIDAGSKGLLYGDIYEYVMNNNKKIRYMLTINLSTNLLYEMYCSFHVDKMVELTNLMKRRFMRPFWQAEAHRLKWWNAMCRPISGRPRPIRRCCVGNSLPLEKNNRRLLEKGSLFFFILPGRKGWPKKPDG